MFGVSYYISGVDTWAPFQYMIRRLIARSCEVSKPQDLHLELPGSAASRLQEILWWGVLSETGPCFLL